MFILWSYETYDNGIDDPTYKTNIRIKSYIFSINDYAKKNMSVPRNIEEIPREKYVHYQYMSRDAWGNTLRYSVDTQKHILTVFSFGRDGVAGGTGEDSDIYVSYFYQKPNGEFWANSETWEKDARVPVWR
jgi:hypothetical protein